MMKKIFSFALVMTCASSLVLADVATEETVNPNPVVKEVCDVVAQAVQEGRTEDVIAMADELARQIENEEQEEVVSEESHALRTHALIACSVALVATAAFCGVAAHKGWFKKDNHTMKDFGTKICGHAKNGTSKVVAGTKKLGTKAKDSSVVCWNWVKKAFTKKAVVVAPEAAVVDGPEVQVPVVQEEAIKEDVKDSAQN